MKIAQRSCKLICKAMAKELKAKQDKKIKVKKNKNKMKTKFKTFL